MWPGEQQHPGGQQYPQQPQNPQWQGPPQDQPPGYGPPPQNFQPQGYQQPAEQQWGPPPPGGPGDPRPPGNRKALVAGIAAAAAVVLIGVAVGAGMLLGDETEDSVADPARSPSSEASVTTSGSPTPTATASATGGGFTDAPRGAPQADVKPVVPGWQAVTRYDYGVAYDVPKGWTVASDTLLSGYTSTDKKVTTIMGGTAAYQQGWCGENSKRGLVGAKGGKGAKSLAEAAYNEAENWAYAKYQGTGKGTLTVTDAKVFTNAQGISGYAASANITGIPSGGCNADGAVYTVSFVGADKLARTWVLIVDTGFSGALDTGTIDKMRNSIRQIG